jgi:hypothetical protein
MAEIQMAGVFKDTSSGLHARALSHESDKEEEEILRQANSWEVGCNGLQGWSLGRRPAIQTGALFI